MPGPARRQVDPNDYLAGIFGGGGGGGGSTAMGQPRIIDVGNDNGRGPGGPGGRGTGLTGVQVAPPVQQFVEDDVAKILKGMPPERIAQIQRRMQTVGLLPENYKSFGFVENTMRSGFAELLQVANNRGENNWDNTLDLLVDGQQTTLSEERVNMARKRQQQALAFNTSLNTYERSDPASVRQTAEQAFQQALGRKPKKNELDRFVNGFLSRERGSQKAVFDAQDSLESGQRDRAMRAIDLEEADAILPAGGGKMSEAQELQARLDRMIADAPGRITKGKKTRSYEEQVRLYERYKAGKGPLAAKPGTSKHGDGRANDLRYENDEVRAWVLKNAGRYGLAVPLYNPKLGRGRDESWHIELANGSRAAGHSPNDGHNHGPATPAAAPVSTNVTAQRQDLGAQAVEYARNVNPNETAAYDIGGQFTNLLAILQRGVI